MCARGASFGCSESARLFTRRLTLIPFSLDLLRLALADNRNALEECLLARVLPRWAAGHERKFLTDVIQALDADPASWPWRGYLMMHTADRAVIGSAGFKGPPDRAGTVEIGYGIVPAYRRQGYTFEAVEALVEWAFGHPEVMRVTAQCDDDNAGSIRILEKLGMHRTGGLGRILSWELSRV
jgi:ribosomal-protein-alanine N-acetyltransferase